MPVSTDDVVDCVGSDCVDTSSGCFGQDEGDCACQVVSHEDHHAIIVRSVVDHGCRVGGRSVPDVDVVGVLIEHESKQGRRTGVKIGEVCLHGSSSSEGTSPNDSEEACMVRRMFGPMSWIRGDVAVESAGHGR